MKKRAAARTTRTRARNAVKPPAAEGRPADPFHILARRRAAGELLVPPAMLPPDERRLHIRRTLREDHELRIDNRPEEAQAKFETLGASPFVFFRGTALLYYRDLAGSDADLPVVLTIGDVHPENFGVMPNEDGAPFFGINDFDEAGFAPFTWDVKRGATGFELATRENGFPKPQRKKVVRSWVAGYVTGLRDFAQGDRELRHQFRIDNSPPMIRELLESSLKDRRNFLAKVVELEKSQFLPTDEVVPYSRHVGEFQKAIDTYREQSDVHVNEKIHFKVKDVAVKKGSGTSSLGLERYWVLIDGPTDDPGDDVILELKQARRSALHALAPQRHTAQTTDAERIVTAHKVHLVGGDPYYGTTVLDGRNFLVRERSPFKNDLDMDELDFDAMREYAEICGYILAQAHARTDDVTEADDAEEQILSAINERLFAEDIARFARTAAKRVIADWKLFKKDLAIGAYQFAPAL
jgi:uncharacterized protein (DUF2252 family)